MYSCTSSHRLFLLYTEAEWKHTPLLDKLSKRMASVAMTSLVPIISGRQRSRHEIPFQTHEVTQLLSLLGRTFPAAVNSNLEPRSRPQRQEM